MAGVTSGRRGNATLQSAQTGLRWASSGRISGEPRTGGASRSLRGGAIGSTLKQARLAAADDTAAQRALSDTDRAARRRGGGGALESSGRIATSVDADGLTARELWARNLGPKPLNIAVSLEEFRVALAEKTDRITQESKKRLATRVGAMDRSLRQLGDVVGAPWSQNVRWRSFLEEETRGPHGFCFASSEAGLDVHRMGHQAGVQARGSATLGHSKSLPALGRGRVEAGIVSPARSEATMDGAAPQPTTQYQAAMGDDEADSEYAPLGSAGGIPVTSAPHELAPVGPGAFPLSAGTDATSDATQRTPQWRFGSLPSASAAARTPAVRRTRKETYEPLPQVSEHTPVIVHSNEAEDLSWGVEAVPRERDADAPAPRTPPADPVLSDPILGSAATHPETTSPPQDHLLYLRHVAERTQTKPEEKLGFVREDTAAPSTSVDTDKPKRKLPKASLIRGKLASEVPRRAPAPRSGVPRADHSVDRDETARTAPSSPQGTHDGVDAPEIVARRVTTYSQKRTDQRVRATAVLAPVASGATHSGFEASSTEQNADRAGPNKDRQQPRRSRGVEQGWRAGGADVANEPPFRQAPTVVFPEISEFVPSREPDEHRQRAAVPASTPGRSLKPDGATGSRTSPWSSPANCAPASRVTPGDHSSAHKSSMSSPLRPRAGEDDGYSASPWPTMEIEEDSAGDHAALPPLDLERPRNSTHRASLSVSVTHETPMSTGRESLGSFSVRSDASPRSVSQAVVGYNRTRQETKGDGTGGPPHERFPAEKPDRRRAPLDVRPIRTTSPVQLRTVPYGDGTPLVVEAACWFAVPEPVLRHAGVGYGSDSAALEGGAHRAGRGTMVPERNCDNRSPSRFGREGAQLLLRQPQPTPILDTSSPSNTVVDAGPDYSVPRHASLDGKAWRDAVVVPEPGARTPSVSTLSETSTARGSNSSIRRPETSSATALDPDEVKIGGPWRAWLGHCVGLTAQASIQLQAIFAEGLHKVVGGADDAARAERTAEGRTSTPRRRPLQDMIRETGNAVRLAKELEDALERATGMLPPPPEPPLVPLPALPGRFAPPPIPDWHFESAAARPQSLPGFASSEGRRAGLGTPAQGFRVETPVRRDWRAGQADRAQSASSASSASSMAPLQEGSCILDSTEADSVGQLRTQTPASRGRRPRASPGTPLMRTPMHVVRESTSPADPSEASEAGGSTAVGGHEVEAPEYVLDIMERFVVAAVEANAATASAWVELRKRKQPIRTPGSRSSRRSRQGSRMSSRRSRRVSEP